MLLCYLYLHFYQMSVGQANMTYTVQGSRLRELLQVRQTGLETPQQKVWFFIVCVISPYSIHIVVLYIAGWYTSTN